MIVIENDLASGLRRSTPANRAAARLADDYEGLPAGVTRWRLAAALRAAAQRLALTEPMLRLLEHYIDLSYDIDWAADSEPVICRPLVEIAEYLGKTERQIRNIERALVDRGLLAWRDSANHHRKGRRDRRSGRLVYAYGPSLAPLGHRAEEIIALASAARRDLAEGRRLRIAIAALRRRIRADLAAAMADGLDVGPIATAFAALPIRNPAGQTLAMLDNQRQQLDAIATNLAALCGCELDSQSDKISPKREINDLHKTDTCNYHSINEVGTPLKKRHAGGRVEPHEASAMPHRNMRTDAGLKHIGLGLALAAAPETLRQVVTITGRPNWSALVEAACERAVLCGIGPALWGQACRVIGRNGAALCAIIVERGLERRESDPFPPVRRPDAYFTALIERAETGALHLDRSIRALASQEAAP